MGVEPFGARPDGLPQEFSSLESGLSSLLTWLKDVALPYWGSVGIDAAHGGFHERLDLEGEPVRDVPKRLMVQGRQLYVFSRAASLGWVENGSVLASDCVDYIVSKFYRADGRPGWVHSLAPDGSLADATRDSYAHAFVLFGLAEYYSLTRDQQAIALAKETISYLDEFAGSPHGGYLDAVPPPDAIRRQNPHMHLFEAFLALFAATNDSSYLARASEIFGVFSTSFYQPDPGWLCENLTTELTPYPGSVGTVVEPGHHYEWVWLLRWFETCSGRSVGRFCDALYRHADLYGWDEQRFVIDEISPTGEQVKRSRRSWPHAEALKANMVERALGRAGCAERAIACISRLSGTFLATPFPAGWIDRVDTDGKSLVNFVPASSLYHVFCALTEAARSLAPEAAVGKPR